MIELAIALAIALAAVPANAAGPGPAAPSAPPRTMSEILAATTPADWRPLDPENTLYLQLPQGRVVIELAAAFAPLHVDNLRGHNAHHQIETVFKAFGRALRMAVTLDERMAGQMPSTKGCL